MLSMLFILFYTTTIKLTINSQFFSYAIFTINYNKVDSMKTYKKKYIHILNHYKIQNYIKKKKMLYFNKFVIKFIVTKNDYILYIC